MPPTRAFFLNFKFLVAFLLFLSFSQTCFCAMAVLSSNDSEQDSRSKSSFIHLGPFFGLPVFSKFDSCCVHFHNSVSFSVFHEKFM